MSDNGFYNTLFKSIIIIIILHAAQEVNSFFWIFPNGIPANIYCLPVHQCTNCSISVPKLFSCFFV